MAAPSSAVVVLKALDVLEAALMSDSRDEAVVRARAAVSGLDQDMLRRVATALAVEAAWEMRPRGGKRTTQQFIDRLRLEATWVAS